MYFVTLIFAALFICQHIGASTISYNQTDDLDSRIIGGSKVKITKHPYMAFVYLKLNNGKYDACGGSIIGKQWVITAAHCLESTNVDSIFVRVGSTEAWEGGTSVKVIETIYKDYNKPKKLHNDIVLLKLDQELKWSSTVKCIDLSSSKDTKPDTDCTLTGWGQYERGGMSKKLRSVKLPIFERKTCNKVLNSKVKVTKNMICAGYSKKKKGSCNGDSGGPLVCKNKLVGIDSWRIGECGESPNVYTNVGRYREWILQQTSINPNKCGS